MKWLNEFGFKIIALFSLLIPLSVYSQTNNEWNEGKLILKNKTIQYGLINFSPNNQILQINLQGNIIAYSAFQTESFQYYDPEEEQDRKFFVFPYSKNSSYLVDKFFELLCEGKKQLLSTEKISLEKHLPDNSYSNTPYTNDAMYDDQRYVTQVRNREYFIKDAETGKINYISNIKKYLKELTKKDIRLKKYVKDNKLHLNKHEDIVTFMKQVNQ